MDSWDPALISALNLILAAGFPMFITWGPDLRMFYNDAYEPAVAGKGVCIGRPFSSIFPEAWPGLKPIVDKALAGQSSYYEDHPVPLARNAVLSSTWWSFSYSPLTRTDGSVGGVLGVVYETTRRFLAEQALRSNEAALIAVTDMAPGLLWRCSPQGDITWANQRLLDFVGVDALEDLSWDSRVHADDVKVAQRIHEVCKATGRAFESQQRLRGSDGEYRWFMVRSQQVLNGEGQIAGWCGSATDINEWRSAVDGLGERDDLLRDFASADATLMWVADVPTRVVEALNPESRASWALPTTEAAATWETWLSSVHPDDQPHLATMFDRIASGEVVQVKFRKTIAGDVVRRFHATGFPMPGPDGAIGRIGGLVVDVTRDVEHRIYLIDPDPARQNALAHALSRSGVRVRTFDDAAAFEKVSSDLLPGCVVLAERNDFPRTLRTAGVLAHSRDRLPWVVVGDFEARMDEVVRLMKLGASDVLIESRGAPEVAAAASSALANHKVGRPATRAPADARQRIAQLSQREREVLDGLAAGCTNKAIAQKLSLSPRTIETHRAHLMDRLGVGSLAELLRLAAEASLGGSVKNF